MRRLLVTGGAGFIGTNFVHHWLHNHPGDRLVVLDALTYAGNLDNLEHVRQREEFRFVRGDIRDTSLVETLLREEDLGTIVHFAAESHVDRSITGPDAFIETNVVGTHSLLKAARSCWLEQRKVPNHLFHHVSTDEVYGSLGPTDPAFTETTPYAPNSPYSASKAASDYLVRAYHHTYGLRVTTTNCSNNYGPYHFPEKLIPLMIVNILQGKPLPVYGDGKNVRDWLHVEDHCRAIDLVISKGQPGEVYNVGGGTEAENITIVQGICAAVDAAFLADEWSARQFPDSPMVHGKPSSSLVTYVKDRPGHDRRYAIDCKKVSEQLGYKARTSLEQALRETVRWYVQNAPWWQAILNRKDRP